MNKTSLMNGAPYAEPPRKTGLINATIEKLGDVLAKKAGDMRATGTNVWGLKPEETTIGRITAQMGKPVAEQLATKSTMDDPAFGFAGTTIGKLGPKVAEFAAKLKNTAGLKDLSLAVRNDGALEVQHIAVPKGARKQGIGTAAMEKIAEFADESGLRVVLTPALKDDNFGTTSRNRLVNFYKRFGFVENKGRSKDFAISDGMYREPKKGAAPAAADDFERGFAGDDVDVFHGTHESFSSFDPNAVDIGIHVGTARQAENRLKSLSDPYKSGRSHTLREGANIMPLKATFGKSLEMEDVGNWKDSSILASALEKKGIKVEGLADEAAEVKSQYEDVDDWLNSPENRRNLDDLNTALRDKGYNSVKYKNLVENEYGELTQFLPAVEKRRSLINSEIDQIRKEASGRMPKPPENPRSPTADAELEAFLNAKMDDYFSPSEVKRIDDLQTELSDISANPKSYDDPHSYIILDPENARPRFAKSEASATADDFERGFAGDVKPEKADGILDNPTRDYEGTHRPPGPEDGAPLSDLTGGGRIYPDDVYGPNGARYYGHFGGDGAMDNQTMSIIRSMKDKPSTKVTIYRAIPSVITNAEKLAKIENQMAAYMRRGTIPDGENAKGWYDYASALRDKLRALPPEASTAKPIIGSGDWVTVNRNYAKDHGEHSLKGEYRILSKVVRADEVFTNGDSIHEYGYWPKSAKTK